MKKFRVSFVYIYPSRKDNIVIRDKILKDWILDELFSIFQHKKEKITHIKVEEIKG